VGGNGHEAAISEGASNVGQGSLHGEWKGGLRDILKGGTRMSSGSPRKINVWLTEARLPLKRRKKKRFSAVKGKGGERSYCHKAGGGKRKVCALGVGKGLS